MVFSISGERGDGMENRNRNTALVLIAAGLFLLLGHLIGFFTVAALIIIWLSIHKIRSSEEKTGYILLAVGILMLLNNHLVIVIAIVLISLGYFYIKSKQLHRDDTYMQKQNLLESLKWDKEPWVAQNMSLWYLVGEINMDLSLALFEETETTMILQGVIGDVDIIVPEDMGVSIHASVLFGQVDVGRDREAGVLNRMVWTSPHYEASEHKLKLMLSYIVGDVDIKVV